MQKSGTRFYNSNYGILLTRTSVGQLNFLPNNIFPAVKLLREFFIYQANIGGSIDVLPAEKPAINGCKGYDIRCVGVNAPKNGICIAVPCHDLRICRQNRRCKLYLRHPGNLFEVLFSERNAFVVYRFCYHQPAHSEAVHFSRDGVCAALADIRNDYHGSNADRNAENGQESAETFSLKIAENAFDKVIHCSHSFRQWSGQFLPRHARRRDL